MNGFSGIVRISNVSDFIEPSQKCILPLANEEKINSEPQNLVKIHSKTLLKSEKKNQDKVKVTLSDCLACSGCITTAEAMLVQSQTVEQMFEGISNHAVSLVTVSPQSLCSLAVYFNYKPPVMAKIISQFFSSNGVKHTLDSSFFRVLSHKLYYKEFYNQFVVSKLNETKKTIFTGVCPGFVCYAEKTHGELFVPLISRVRSPQAISSALIKDFFKRKYFINKASDIFHISIMPCYDKKLEASRKDFLIDNSNGVDCVITASEIQNLLENFIKNNFFNLNLTNSEINSQINWLNRFEMGNIIGDENEESSGGYANYIIQQLLQQIPNLKIEKIKKNKDWEEFIVNLNSNRTLTIAKIYGFRNIQNVVQKLKRQKLNLDFVEIMACPSGCSNGGGQIRGNQSDERIKITELLNQNYKLLNCDFNKITSEMDDILKEWSILNNKYEELLYTDYYVIKNYKNIETW